MRTLTLDFEHGKGDDFIIIFLVLENFIWLGAGGCNLDKTNYTSAQNRNTNFNYTELGENDDLLIFMSVVITDISHVVFRWPNTKD